MLATEAIERIRILSERGLGSKAIAKSTGITRNTVRKYLTHIQQKNTHCHKRPTTKQTRCLPRQNSYLVCILSRALSGTAT